MFKRALLPTGGGAHSLSPAEFDDALRTVAVSPGGHVNIDQLCTWLAFSTDGAKREVYFDRRATLSRAVLAVGQRLLDDKMKLYVCVLPFSSLVRL